MKTLIPFTLAAALAASGFTHAQTAFSNSSGYITVPIAGNVAGSSAGAGTFVSAPLANLSLFAGSATASPSGGQVISFNGGVPLNLSGASMLEITNGASEGWWTTVASSTATSVTITDSFPAGLAANVAVAVRKFTTIQDVFGENEAGLIDASNSPFDEIQILDAASAGQPTKTVVRSGADWFDFVAETVANEDIIYPGTAVKVIRRGALPLSLVIKGGVRVTKTHADVFPGTNWIGQPNPVGETFGGIQVASQLNPADGANPDFIDILRPNQSADTFVAVGANILNFVTEADANTESLPEGNGFVLKRSSSQVATTVVFPGQVISN